MGNHDSYSDLVPHYSKKAEPKIRNKQLSGLKITVSAQFPVRRQSGFADEESRSCRRES